MTLPYSFGNQTTPNTSWLDSNFNALGSLTTVVCTASGTNAIALTIAANNPAVTALANFMAFFFVAPAANMGAVTIQVGSLAALNAYVDLGAGPTALTGGEIQPNNLTWAIYDSALNSGAGGYHIRTRPMINPMTATNDIIIGGTSGAPTRLAVGMTGQVLKVGSTGNVIWSDTGLTKASASTVSNSAGVTLTATQLTGGTYGTGVIVRSGATGNFTDTTDTAAHIIAGLPAAAVNVAFTTRMIVTGGTQTLSGGTGVTITGSVTTSTSVGHTFLGIITAITPTPTLTMYG